MRVLNINFQSVKSKVHELSLLLDSAKPDIILGCEIWLKPEIHIHNSVIMPPNYTMYRNDRKDGYGGVLIGVRLDIISTEYVNNKNIELVPVKVQLSKQKPLRDLPFNLKGRGGEEVMVFCFVQNFFFGQHES
jgi:exonuclease III